MKDYELKNIDSEDIEDLLVKVETSLDIKFVDDELVHITTFGQLCDHIANKIQLDNVEDCTSQQAFYKLRKAISSTLQLDENVVSPDFLLKDILPRQGRRSNVKNLEKYLGFKLNLLRLPRWITGTFVIIVLASFFGLFLNFEIGFLGLVFSIGGLWFANKIGNELDLKTVRQVAEKMTSENYLKSRRNSNAFNKKEIENVLTNLFSKELGIEKINLTREAKFI
ncbi:MAG: hypothetical protein Q8T04_11035 [Bacteroidota bacterium]|nr:hypothetical protein [Bacteroidota bacterium]